MSFNNDEDGDGLAALFGGITPTAEPKAAPVVPPAPVPQPPIAQQPVPRPLQPAQVPVAEPQGAQPQTPAAQPYAAQPYAAQPYAPQPFSTSAPAYRAPQSYDLPPPPGATPTPTAPPYPDTAQYPGLQQQEPTFAPAAGPTAPPSYQLPPPVSYDLPAPAAPPSYTTPSSHEAPPYEAPSYEAPPQSFESPSYASAQSVADEARAAYGTTTEAPVRVELPTPAVMIPVGPLLPTSRAAVDTPEDLDRATAGERVGVALALLTGPIGLTVAIVSAARGSRRRGWLIGISRLSLVLGVLSTIATAIAGVILWNIRVDQIQHDDLAAASAEFCAAAAEDPAMVTPTLLGWPAPGNSIPESIETMTVWTERWTELAVTSPAELRAGLELLAEKGQTIVDSVTTTRLIDDAANQALIASAEPQSGVANWYTTYCVAP